MCIPKCCRTLYIGYGARLTSQERSLAFVAPFFAPFLPSCSKEDDPYSVVAREWSYPHWMPKDRSDPSSECDVVPEDRNWEWERCTSRCNVAIIKCRARRRKECICRAWWGHNFYSRVAVTCGLDSSRRSGFTENEVVDGKNIIGTLSLRKGLEGLRVLLACELNLSQPFSTIVIFIHTGESNSVLPQREEMRKRDSLKNGWDTGVSVLGAFAACWANFVTKKIHRRNLYTGKSNSVIS